METQTNQATATVVTMDQLANMVFANDVILTSKDVRTRENDKRVKATELSEPERIRRKDEINDKGLIFKYEQIKQDFVYKLGGDSILRIIKDFAVKKMDIAVQASERKLQEATQHMKDHRVVEIITKDDLSGRKEAVTKEDASVVECRKILSIMDSTEIQEDQKSGEIQRVIMTNAEPLRAVLKYFYQGTVTERNAAKQEAK